MPCVLYFSFPFSTPALSSLSLFDLSHSGQIYLNFAKHFSRHLVIKISQLQSLTDKDLPTTLYILELSRIEGENT